jgi:hypothetical protein
MIATILVGGKIGGNGWNTRGDYNNTLILMGV